MAVAFPRARKARETTAPLTMESSPQWQIWVFLYSCSSYLMLTNEKTNQLSRKPLSRSRFLLKRTVASRAFRTAVRPPPPTVFNHKKQIVYKTAYQTKMTATKNL
ncbi:hypothetical protein Y032_0084g1719 [Ancylostoma ceylanicum]|uniref:Uncharacterized protein n=1 Tax=Ancylostoma ceylanicum TaxID=53326 RepID=A0A016TQH7_9BILA|nr:hypothetical protein Y032_0084g1719 [Ancylostoma ceylanicum]